VLRVKLFRFEEKVERAGGIRALRAELRVAAEEKTAAAQTRFEESLAANVAYADKLAKMLEERAALRDKAKYAAERAALAAAAAAAAAGGGGGKEEGEAEEDADDGVRLELSQDDQRTLRELMEGDEAEDEG
jgi:hypothetical protein